MKHAVLSAGLLLGMAMTPAYADDAASTGAASGESGQKTHTQETVHPPTNRVGEAVPTMKTDQDSQTQAKSKTVTPSELTGDGKAASDAASQNRPETVHPPTNRVGTAVPTMTNDKKSGSTTE
jgi:hypothetical protein